MLGAGRSIFVSVAIVALCLAIGGTAAAQQPAYFSADNILRFADYLFAEKEYLKAAVEYERYLSAEFTAGVDTAFVQLKIARCFALAGMFPKAESAYRLVADRFPESEAAQDARIGIAHSQFLAGGYRESGTSAREALPLMRTEARRRALVNLEGLNLLYQKHWREAESFFLTAAHAGDPVSTELRAIAVEGQRLPRKSTGLAAVLSSIAPGTGRIYAGRKADGILSLATFVLTSWQAYTGFQRDGSRSVKGWVYGSLGTFLYVGNVYGSVVAVRLFNERSEKRLLDRAGVSVSVLLP